MRFARLFSGIAILLCAIVPAHTQDYSKFLFNVGGGIGFPLGNLSNFVNDGGNFVIGGGYGFMKHVGVDTEFMWHDLPINDATKAHLQTPGASARQYSWTFNPIVHAQIGDRFGVYGIGGIGWYHRSGETTTPGVGVICDPYWSWWYGCTLGSVNIITGSRSSNSFGENIGGGATIRLGGGHVNFYTEIRYHHAGYSRVSTNLLPLTFGIRLF
jgi:opacity protein-like surface antigen